MTTSVARQSSARELLVSAAQELYAANGVAATTPRQVLERSGVGQGSLYHHFPSKHDLAAAAVGRTAEQTLEGAAALLSGEAPAGERIAAYLRKDRDALAGCRVGRLTADPLVMAHGDLRDPVGAYFASLVRLMGDAFIEDGLDEESARNRATASVAVIQGGYVLSRALGDASQMQRAVRGLLELLDAATVEGSST